MLQTLTPYFQTTHACPLCGSHTHRGWLQVNGCYFHDCNACHFRFMNPHLSDEGMAMLYRNSEMLAQVNPALERYYEYDVKDDKSRTGLDYRFVLKFVGKTITPMTCRPKLFEVGYGSGSFLRAAAHEGWQVEGVDTSDENTQMVRDKYHFKVTCGTFEVFAPPQNVYHMVVLWDVIEHTMHPRSYVEKAYEMLVPGGLLVLATPNIGGLLNLISQGLYFLSRGRVDFAVKQLYVLEHVGYYSQKTLRRLVTQQGFLFQKAWLTETDLERYEFSPWLKSALRIFFLFARILRLGNRIILFAQKPSHES